jgi:hypothetical protein
MRAFAAVALGKLDPAIGDRIHSANVNPVRTDNFHVRDDFFAAHASLL